MKQLLKWFSIMLDLLLALLLLVLPYVSGGYIFYTFQQLLCPKIAIYPESSLPFFLA